MRIKSVLAAVGAFSLMAAPAAASAQAAAQAPAELAPQAEQVEGSELRGGFILPLLVIAAIVAAIILLTRGDDGAISP